MLVVQAGRGHQHGEQEPGRAGQDVALATVQPLAAVPAAVALLRAAAHALRVDQAGPGLDGAAAGGARRRRERTGGGFPSALTAEAVPPPADGLPRREIPRQRPPAATLGHEVEASLHDLPDGGAHRPVARKEAGGQRPLRVGEIARVALADFVMDVSILCRPHVIARKMNSSSCENMGTVRSNRLLAHGEAELYDLVVRTLVERAFDRRAQPGPRRRQPRHHPQRAAHPPRPLRDAREHPGTAAAFTGCRAVFLLADRQAGNTGCW